MLSKFSFFIASLLWTVCYAAQDGFASLEDEYTPLYCLQLEAAYGDGMMSEGGVEGIEHMFDRVSLHGKSALDIGCGLGGVAFYLAEKYDMHVTGLEVNRWMVSESERRIPSLLKDRVHFVLSTNNQDWPIASESYDIIYSKGVLTHLEVKDPVFQESYRLLKKGGLLIITDWLSSDRKAWGENVKRLVELENLALYPESKTGYIQTLAKNGFTVLSIRDESSKYLGFNQKIVTRLQDPEQLGHYASYFTKEGLQASIEGYESIANALEAGELRTVRFIAQKN